MVDDERILTKLEHVRVLAVKKLLLTSVNLEELKNRYRILGNGETQDIQKSLSRLSLNNLIEIVRISHEISQTQIDEVYEEHRYKGKPSFFIYTLHSIGDTVDIETIMHEEWQTEFNNEIQVETDLQKPSAQNIKFLDYEEIIQGVIEIHFSYETIYKYTNTETAEPDHLYELKYSFIWLSLGGNFFVIHSVPEGLKQKLENFVFNKFRVLLVSIVLSEVLVNNLFDRENIRRTSLYNPNPEGNMPERVSISDSQLHQKGILDQYEGYQSPGRVYEEIIEAGTTAILGITNRKGKLWLSKSLKASSLREWSINRIIGIVQELNRLTRTSPHEAIDTLNLGSKKELVGLKKKERELIIALVKRLIFAKSTNQNAVSLEIDYADIIKNLPTQFEIKLGVYCEECGMDSPIHCPVCKTSSTLTFNSETLNISCTCGHRFNAARCTIECQSTHIINTNVLDLVTLLPKYKLQQLILSLFKYMPTQSLTSYENFNLSANVFNYTNTSVNYILNLSDIPSLAHLEDLVIDDATRARILTNLKLLKEKCRPGVTSQDCTACLSQQNIKCIPKIFYFVQGFRPQPHHGQEFGDVSFNVTVSGQNLTFQGIAKSYASKVCTLGSKTGREMLQQFFSGAKDYRVGVIGYITPTVIHAQLREELKYVCKLTGKRMLIWEEEQLLRAIYYAETRFSNIIP